MKAWEKNIRKDNTHMYRENSRNVTGMIKLNTNENPYPPAPGVLKAMEEFEPEQLKTIPRSHLFYVYKVTVRIL